MSAIFMPVPIPDSPKTGAIYALACDYVFRAIGRIFVVPAGFEFDGASIPPLLWPVIGSPFDPAFMQPALLHDWLYSSHLVTRREADVAFREQLVVNGVTDFRADLMFRAVRLAGWAAWRDTPQDAAYMEWLRDHITADGRNLETYGLCAPFSSPV